MSVPLSIQRLIAYENAEAGGYWCEVAPDIVTVPFWRAGFCRTLIEAAETVGGFQPYGRDVLDNSAPGQELRIDRIDRRPDRALSPTERRDPRHALCGNARVHVAEIGTSGAHRA